MNNKKGLFILIIILITISVIAFIMKYKNRMIVSNIENQATSDNPTDDSLNEAISAPDEMNTYINNTAGFSLQYPASRFKLLSEKEFMVTFVPFDSIINSKYPYWLRISSNITPMNVDVINFRYMTIESYINNSYSSNIGEWYFMDKQPVTIGELAGYSYYSNPPQEYRESGSFPALRASVKKESEVYEITLFTQDINKLFELKELFSQILSSFQFITPSQISGQEIITSPIYCCSITYRCSNAVEKNAFVQNNSVHSLKTKNSTCKQIGEGIPNTAVYEDENCSTTLNPYIDYCQN